MKKVLSVLVIIFIIITPTKNIKAFMDVNEDDWCNTGIDYVIRNNLMKGVSEDEFDPNGTVNRAMVVTVLYRLQENPIRIQLEDSFKDVYYEDYFYYPVSWSSMFGIVNGYSKDQFKPYKPITHEELVNILYRFHKRKGGQLIEPFVENINLDDIYVFDYSFVPYNWALSYNIEGINEGSFVQFPRENATRAEFASLLHWYSNLQYTSKEVSSQNDTE